MATQITLTLPDELYERVERFANLANCDVTAVLTNTIQQGIPLVTVDPQDGALLAQLPDEEILSLTQLQLDPVQDQRMSLLLERQQAGAMPPQEKLELKFLMQLYQEGLLRKATALAEAVRRELIPPLES